MRDDIFQKVLADFKNAVAKYRLRVYHRMVERDVTEADLQALEKRIEEYRALPESRGYFENRQATGGF